MSRVDMRSTSELRVAAAPPWRLPGRLPRLDVADVHVWRVNLAAIASMIPHLLGVLSEQELAGRDTSRLDARSRQFIGGRACLRLILSVYVDAPASALAFVLGSHGKPALAEPCADGGIEFNVAHSADWVVCAIAHARAVGVDIEHRRPVAHAAGIARMLFSTTDQRSLSQGRTARRDKAFFDMWTRREALVKLKGQSLFTDVQHGEIDANTAVSFARHSADARSSHACSVCALAVAPGYSAALAVAGRSPRLTLFHCDNAFLISRLLAERERTPMPAGTARSRRRLFHPVAA